MQNEIQIQNTNPPVDKSARAGFSLEGRTSVILNQFRKVFSISRAEDRPSYVWTAVDKKIHKIDPSVIR